MSLLDIKSRVQKYIAGLDAKQTGQISKAIVGLGSAPVPRDSEDLTGYAPLRRKDVGEYRVVYWYDEETDTVRIPLIGKRNGDEVYDDLKRLFEGKGVTLQRLIQKLR